MPTLLCLSRHAPDLFRRRGLLLAMALAGTSQVWGQHPAPASIRVLKVAAPWDIGSLDPAKNGYIFSRLEVAETLVEVDGQGQLVPGLASQWRVSADQRTWTCKLRHGVVFHDHSPMTATAVVRCLVRAWSQPGLLKGIPIRQIMASADLVQIHLNRPFTALPAYLAHSSTQILAPGSFAADGSVKAVIGSGPYKVVRLDAPRKVEVQAFEGWRGRRPEIERVEYLATDQGLQRAMLADRGEADLVFTHDAQTVERLKHNPQLRFQSLPIPRTVYLKVNASHPWLQDAEVRQALSRALDRVGIASAILREPKAAATQLFTPGMSEWHVPSLPPLTRDVPRARQALIDAGWQAQPDGLMARDGQTFKLILRTFADRPELPPIARAIQTQLRDIGIEVSVVVGSTNDIPAGHRDGSLELALLARNYALVPDPLGTLLQDFGPEGGDWGAMGWQSVQAHTTLAGLSTTTDATRRAQLRGALATTLQAELPVIPVVWYQHNATYSHRVERVSLDPLERSYRISQMSWARL